LALAELLRNNYIPEGYIYPIELREARDLARRRMNIVKKRAGELREFKMALTRHGFDGPNRNAIVSMKDEILEPYRGFDRHLDQILEDTLYFNQVYTESIKSIESSLEDILEGDEIIERLREIPGIGPWLSKYIRLEVESIERFKNILAFSSWCRVIPGIAQSVDSCVRGRGSKQGNGHMKYALYQSAAFVIRLNPQIKAYYMDTRNEGVEVGERWCLSKASRSLHREGACSTEPSTQRNQDRSLPLSLRQPSGHLK
jgi:transposase